MKRCYSILQMREVEIQTMEYIDNTLFRKLWRNKLSLTLLLEYMTIWQYLSKLQKAVDFDLLIPLLGIYPSNVLAYMRNIS